jgi:2-methylisocitrate lyase-like PEP mutase family enzyme
MTALRALLQQGTVVAPGVFNALTAALAAEAGFTALYLSGAAIAYTRLGAPDIGLVSMSEVAETIALVRDRVATPLVVDADNGFGNALNVQRTVRMFERAGASAIQLEDQTMPKRCGHLRGKSLIPPTEMIGKIHAALDARASAETLIIARTDAVAVEGLEAALARAAAYGAAGADILFVEAPQDQQQLAAIGATLGGGGVPLVVNMVDGGDTPPLPVPDLEKLGFSLVIFPGGIVRALARTARRYYASLAAHRSNLPFASDMMDFTGLNDLLGTPGLLALGARYERGGA